MIEDADMYLQSVLVWFLCISVSQEVLLPERIVSAQEESNAVEVVKIAREIADEILGTPDAPDPVRTRLKASVLGLFRKAEALDPQIITSEDAGRIGRLYLLLAESYADEAKRYLMRSLSERDREVERVALGNAFLYTGDAARARLEYLKVSQTRPDDSVLAVNLSLAERALGDTSSAESRLRRILAGTPNSSVQRAAALSIADIELSSGNLEASRVRVLGILQTNHGDREALSLLKQIYEKQGRVDLAKSIGKELGASMGRRTGQDNGPTIKGDRK